MLKKIAVIILLLIALSFTTFPLISVKGNNNITKVQLDPSTITVQEIGKTFAVNVTIANVTSLCAWDFKLHYRNSVLTCIDATEGPFLRTGGGTYWAENITDTYNSTHGRVRFGSTLLGAVPGVNGSGVLATITFQTQGGGDTQLHFDDTQLYDCEASPNSIEHEAIDGEVHVGIHDVAITNVFPSKTMIVQGCNANITVTAENQGEFTETFNITVYANTTIIDTLINTTLASGNSTTITFTWNTTSFVKGNYTLKAYAWPVSSETYTEDNMLVDGWIVLTISGDVNGDYTVDIYDAILLSASFGAEEGSPNWNPNVDINSDGITDIFDAIILSNNFGKTDP